MSKKLIAVITLAGVLGIFGPVHGADAGGNKRAGAAMAQTLLDHADELGLSAEQKTKLQDMAKGPMSILTDEQKTKAREMIQTARAAAKTKKADKKPEDIAKIEEKKPEDKKDGDKTEPEKKEADKTDTEKK